MGILRAMTKSAASHDPRQLAQQLNGRRTMIPVQLVLGIFAVGSGAAQWLLDGDHPYSATNLRWTAVTLPLLGLLLLGTGVMNMLYVRRRLREHGTLVIPRQ